MLKITEFSAEKLNDPFGIITGDRYEFLVDIEVPEDDELYSENGLYIRILFAVDQEESRIIKYDIYEKGEDKILDFDLEEEEESALFDFCLSHLDEEASI